jgi:hypothetical protein
LSNQQVKVYPISTIRVDDVKPDPDNPNEMSDQTYKALVTSLQTFGELDPIIIRKTNNMIIDGHHRVKAYKENGYDTISAYIIPDDELTEQHIKLMRQALNKIHGEHNPKQDVNELLNILSSPNNQDIELLQNMFNVNSENIKDLQKMLESPNKDEWQDMLMATTDRENLLKTHEISLLMSDDEFNIFNTAVDSWSEMIDTNFKNSTKALISLLRSWLEDRRIEH